MGASDIPGWDFSPLALHHPHHLLPGLNHQPFEKRELLPHPSAQSHLVETTSRVVILGLYALVIEDAGIPSHNVHLSPHLDGSDRTSSLVENDVYFHWRDRLGFT